MPQQDSDTTRCSTPSQDTLAPSVASPEPHEIWRDTFAQLRDTTDRWSPCVDVAAELVAARCRRAIATKIGIALTWAQWQELLRALKIEIAVGLRHAKYEPLPFPGIVPQPERVSDRTTSNTDAAQVTPPGTPPIAGGGR